MSEINKEAFGDFISQLRKEKGYTQKDLAQKLFISDKAISKWETGASIPDIALLIPLSEILGVTTTELLICKRIEQEKNLDTKQVENLVKQTISYTSSEKIIIEKHKKKWMLLYVLSLIISSLITLFLIINNRLSSTTFIVVLISIIFGGYFCLFAKEQLPTFYDENKINFYSDGIFRINIPGVHFNNSNWPHILNVCRIWTIISVIGYPILCLVASYLFPLAWLKSELFVCLAIIIGGIFIPVYIVGKKYE